MSFFARLARHARLSWLALRPRRRQTPPFLIVFINSHCNLTCDHCFYWRNLNRRDDLTFAEFRRLADELGPFENLNLSGGEPFLRPDFAEICTLFVERNGVKQIYVPTNGYYTDKMATQIEKVLRSRSLKLFACELSLDGMPEYHDRLRGNPRSFARAMDTYDMLETMQERDARLRIHAISTATADNVEELAQLSEYLHDRCPAMDHHNLAILRGDRKDPNLRTPTLASYRTLCEHVARVWKRREQGRFGSIVEPLLQWAKCKTIETDSQYVPCTAGKLTGVVYANGDVSLCELHTPLGNLRERSFFDIWDSERARALRADVAARRCHCTTEVFLWPSIVFQPWQLARALLGSTRRPGVRAGAVSLPVVEAGEPVGGAR